MYGRNLRRVDQSSQYSSTRPELDERGQVQKHASGGTSERNVGKIGANAGNVYRVGSRIFTGRITNGITVSSECKHKSLYPCSPHNTVVRCNRTSVSRPHFVTYTKDTHYKVSHWDDLAFAEGRLALVEPDGKTTPSNASLFRPPFLVDLTAPPPLLRAVLVALDFPCPATFSSACSLLAISWYSSIVFSTTHAQCE